MHLNTLFHSARTFKTLSSRCESNIGLKSDNKDGNYPTYTINTEDIVEVWYVTMYASKQMPEPVDIYDRLHELESKVVDLEGALQHKLLK